MSALPFRPETNPWPEGFEPPRDELEKQQQQQGRPLTDQWVSSVPRWSSRYGSGESWSASRIAGPPTVQSYGDSGFAWAPASPNSAAEFVELSFEKACLVCRVRIHESFTPGALCRISLWDGDSFVVAHEQESRSGQYPHEMRWEEVEIADEARLVTDRIRLDFDTMGGGSWYEIDAVQISGQEVDTTISAFTEPTTPLTTALGTLLFDRQTADCSLMVSNHEGEEEEPVEIPVHRGILAARCPLFRAMLDRNELPLGGVKRLTGVAPDLVRLILQWIYTGQVEVASFDRAPSDNQEGEGAVLLDTSNCVPMTVASDYFQIDGLTAHCVDFFRNVILTCKNAALLYAHFDSICVEPLKQTCLEFCGQNFLAVSQTEPFQQCLSKSQLLAIIECHHKQVVSALGQEDDDERQDPL